MARSRPPGVDGTSAAIALVESGDLACTIMNNGWLQAGYGAAYAYAAKTGVIKTSEMTTRIACS